MLEKFKSLRPTWPYVSLLVGFGVIYAWRLSGVFWIDSVSGHLSNFALSGILLLFLINPSGFEKREAHTKVFAAAIFLAFANIIVESFNIGNLFTSGIFNTGDMADALFGIIAIVLVTTTYWMRASKRRMAA